MALYNHISILISLILAMILDTLEVFSFIKWIWPAWYLLFCLIWLTNEKYPTSLWLLWAVSIIFDLTFLSSIRSNWHAITLHSFYYA